MDIILIILTSTAAQN